MSAEDFQSDAVFRIFCAGWTAAQPGGDSPLEEPMVGAKAAYRTYRMEIRDEQSGWHRCGEGDGLQVCGAGLDDCRSNVRMF